MARKRRRKRLVARKRLRKRHERATDEHATDAPVPAAVTTTDEATLYKFLTAYFVALASVQQPHPAPLGKAGLTALIYWQDYFDNPDHLQPQDIPFVRGKIWS
jgi:hypothetical protein